MIAQRFGQERVLIGGIVVKNGVHFGLLGYQITPHSRQLGQNLNALQSKVLVLGTQLISIEPRNVNLVLQLSNIDFPRSVPAKSPRLTSCKLTPLNDGPQKVRDVGRKL